MTKNQSLNHLQEVVDQSNRACEAAQQVFDPDKELQISRLMRQLSDTPFANPLTEQEIQIARAAMLSTKTPKVRRLGKDWTVKFYLGQKQRCFGFYQDYVHAMRISDLLTVRYYNRRTVKRLKVLDDDALNITLNRAKLDSDSANEPEIISLLCHIDTLLPEKKPKPSRKNVRLNTVGFQVLRMREELNAMSSTIEQLSSVIEQMVRALLEVKKELSHNKTTAIVP
jgi:hypothetical protein